MITLNDMLNVSQSIIKDWIKYSFGKRRCIQLDEIYDLSIVGGGPGGLSAAVYVGPSQLKTLLLEKGHFVGQIKDTKEICNYPG